MLRNNDKHGVDIHQSKSIKDFVLCHPFLLLFIIAAIVHIFLPLNWGDDKVFSVSTAVPFSQFMQGKARPLTDGLTFVFSRYNILWRISNPFILVLMAKTLTELVPAENKKLSALLFCTLPLYPTMAMVDAGFIATNINYLWPITFALVNLLIFQKTYSEGFRLYYIFALPLLLYALNMEMMTVVLSFAFLFGISVMLTKKKFHLFALMQALLSVGSAVAAYTRNLSGDNSRMVREIARYFPEFESLTLFNKLELGFSSTFYGMTMRGTWAAIGFIAFTAFLAITVFVSKKGVVQKVIAVFPCAFAIVFTTLSLTPVRYNSLFLLLTGKSKNTQFYLFEPIPDIFFIAIAICVLATVAFLLDNKLEILKAYLILGVGLGSRMIMGFSPTVWASGYRTFAVFFITIVIVIVMIADKHYKKTEL